MNKTITLFKDLPILIDRNGLPKIDYEIMYIQNSEIKKILFVVACTENNISILSELKTEKVLHIIIPTADRKLNIKFDDYLN